MLPQASEGDRSQQQQQQQASPSQQPQIAVPAPIMPARPQTLTWIHQPNHVMSARWVVDARKLKGTDKKAVSPEFAMPWSSGDSLEVGSLIFKLLLTPRMAKHHSSPATFKETKGRGVVQLKCADSTVNSANSAHSNDLRVAFRMSLQGQGNARPFLGPFVHDFGLKAVSDTVPKEEEFDLNDVIDERMLTFSVCVEMVPVHRGIPSRWSS